jgi:hypothetical protein
MLKSIIAIAFSVVMFSGFAGEVPATEIHNDNLPVECGKSEPLLALSMQDYGEQLTATWVDSRVGRYVVMVSPETNEMTLFLLIKETSYACIISIGVDYKTNASYVDKPLL